MSKLYISFAEVVITGIWFVVVYMHLLIDSLVLCQCKVDVSHHEEMVIMILCMFLVWSWTWKEDSAKET